MKIDIITISTDYINLLKKSLVVKAINSGNLSLNVHNLRDWTSDLRRSIDDFPYGGGPGMVMKAPIWHKAVNNICSKSTLLIMPTPTGRLFTQTLAEVWTKEEHLAFACGRYEGIDQRVIDTIKSKIRTEEISIGDYVLNSGELAALVIIETIVRLMPNVLGNPISYQQDSHSIGLLEGPKYTRPIDWKGMTVPNILLSGNISKINIWQQEQSLKRTHKWRPDLLI